MVVVGVGVVFVIVVDVVGVGAVAFKEVVEVGGDLYGKLVNGYVLPCALCDIYGWFRGGVATIKWRDFLQSTESAGFA